MPLQKCTKDNKSGWRWGEEGVCYTGKDGKKKAIRQGLAIHGPKDFKDHMKAHGQFDEALNEMTMWEQLIFTMVVTPKDEQERTKQ